MMMWELSDLAGVKDLAEHFQVTRSTVTNWTRRYEDFPFPVTVLSGQPIYSLKAVIGWNANHEWKAPR